MRRRPMTGSCRPARPPTPRTPTRCSPCRSSSRPATRLAAPMSPRASLWRGRSRSMRMRACGS
ncbi:hypothetical protein FRC96_02935 [Lujinxingia vulgaris]|uniref:Uncharacterized protein n=1 Tax=Lujinxingia vulgaris TaxID=2600176 RepID=A0A5C6XEJ8_9DELT|nr:hypothetical protein FRC96_02935 [Lujinxingia vulgaris]